MKRKKNGFFTFIWSFMPGAAEMYMGFMKSGLSLMVLFFASIIIPSIARLEDVFLLLPVLVWFYAFFHARNLASCTEEVLQVMEDDFIWDNFSDGTKTRISSPVLRKWGAVILFVVGGSMLWTNMRNIITRFIPAYIWKVIWPVFDDIPKVIIALLIIAIGFALIIGKKKEVKADES